MKKKNLLKRLNKYFSKRHKEWQKLFKNLYNDCKKFKTNLSKITLVLTATCITTACGSTRVSVEKPATGTCTTITVTTNNPISTNLNTNVELKPTKK